jgi:hypothetical protein
MLIFVLIMLLDFLYNFLHIQKLSNQQENNIRQVFAFFIYLLIRVFTFKIFHKFFEIILYSQFIFFIPHLFFLIFLLAF